MTDDESESVLSDSREGSELELPVIQLCGLVEELSYVNSALKTETEMFEKYYAKLEPRDQRPPRLSEIKIAAADYAQDNMKEKLRLKNVSLKVQRKKMLLQLRQLTQLKLSSGNTLQVLNAYKSKLHKAMEIYINLDKEILLRKELLEKIEKETLQVEEDRAKAEAVNKRLRKQLAEFRVPQVMTYVREKILNGDLEKSIRMWERKVEIAEMSLKGYRKAWNRMKITNEQLQADYLAGK
uniref:Cilia- and flagella-associated protein 263 n=1 Tax=Nomascus leucogenys TaxID=61853 RepID=G1QT55_NOMLE